MNNWKTVQLGDVLAVQNGYAFDSGSFSDEGTPLIRIRDLKNGKETQIRYNGEYDEKYVVNDGDLLIGMDGEFGCYEWNGGRALLNQRVCRLVDFSSALHPKFIHYSIMKSLKEIERRTSYVTVKHLSSRQIKAIEIGLPPLEEQIKIATLLKKVEDLIQQRKESIDLLDELVKSTFLDMFGDPIRRQFQVSKSTLEEVCTFTGGGTPSKSNASFYNGGIPWVTPKDMKKLMISDSKDKITKDAVRRSSAKLIEKGAVLMVIRSGILKNKLPLGINTVSIAINQDMKAIKSVYLLPEFLLFYLKLSERYILSKVRGTTADNIRFDNIKQLKIDVPNHEQQVQFRTYFEKMMLIKSNCVKSLSHLQNLYNSLSQKAFKGELDLSKMNVDHLLPKEDLSKPRAMAMYKEQKNSRILTKAEEDEFFKERNEDAKEMIDVVFEAVGSSKENRRRIADTFDERVTYAQVAKWILEQYKNYHFTTEMLMRFLEEEKEMTPNYFTSKEIKENTKLDYLYDLKSTLYDALQMTDPELLEDKHFLKLEQVFYDDTKKNFKISIRPQDKKLFDAKTPEQRSGVYLKVKA